MRFWLCLALTACGGSSDPAPPPTPAPAAAKPPGPAPAALPAKPAPKPAAPPLTAAHGTEIAALSVTNDGAAVASADKGGGIRLWTVLDGTREPVVVLGTAPRALALARDGDGFSIATLDAAGGVRVIRTSGFGAVRDRVTVASQQPAAELGATASGFLVRYNDQTIAFVGLDGAVAARLTPEPGTHIDSILTRGSRALALVLEDKQLHGRWIELDHGAPGARWGAVTPRLPGKIAHAVLAPGGELLAVTRPRSLHPALIDLQKGSVLPAPLCVAKGWPHEDGMDLDDSELLRDGNEPIPLGFLSDTLVACSVMNALTWWTTDGEAVSTRSGGFSVAAAPFDVSSRAIVVAQGTNLAIGSSTENKFIGYEMHDLNRMHAGPGGLLISGTDQQSLVLDARLQARARIEMGRARIDWLDAIPLDDRYAITLAERRVYGRTDDIQAAVFDGVARAQHQLLPYEVHDPELSYEPTTRLLATTDGGVSLLVAFDPVTHTFGKPARISNGITTGRLRVVDPKLAHGVAALELDPTEGGFMVGEILASDVAPGAIVSPRAPYRVPGELRAVDRAGRLYMHAPDDRDVVIYTHGVAGARLVGAGSSSLHPNADGSLIAAAEAPRIVLLASDGKVRWSAAHWSSNDVVWTPGGELAVQFATGVARLDLATGSIAERHCGWSFGIAEQPINGGRGNASICDMGDADR